MSVASWGASWLKSWAASWGYQETAGHGSSVPHYKRTPIMHRRKIRLALMMAARRD